MLSGMAHLLGPMRPASGAQNASSSGSIETLITAGQLDRVLKHNEFMPHLRMDSRILISYLCAPQTMIRLVEIMCVDLGSQAQIERYYQGKPGIQASSVCSTSIAQRIELADIASEIFSQTMRGTMFLERFLAFRPAVALLFRLLGQDFSPTPAETKTIPTQIRPNPIVARYFITVINSFISTPARITAFASALVSPECEKCFAIWVSTIENSGVAEALRNFIVCQDDFPQQCKAEVYNVLREKNVLENLIDILVCKNEVTSIASVSNCSLILTRILSKNIHELTSIILTNTPRIATMVFSGLPMVGNSMIPVSMSSGAVANKGYAFTSLHLRKAGNVLVYAMSWMCYNSALRCQDMLGKLAATVRQYPDRSKPSVYDSDPIYMHSPNMSKLIKLSDNHLRSININYYDTFFSVVSTIDRLQNRFSSFNTNTYMILEVLARFLGITADIKIAMHYKRYGEPPANEFSGLDLNVFLMNDLNPLSYGYLSPTAQSGSGGPSATKLSSTFIFNCQDGTKLYNPICPLEICKRICINKILEKIIQLMESHPSMSTLHFLGSRLILSMVEYGNLAPSIVQHVLLDSGLLSKFAVFAQPSPQNQPAYKSIKQRDSWTTYLATFGQTFLRMASSVTDEREYKSKYANIAIRGKEEINQVDVTYPRTLDDLETHASKLPESCDLMLIKVLFGSNEFTRFSKVFLAKELLSPRTYNDNHIAFIGKALQSDQTNISVFRLSDVKEAMCEFKLTGQMIPRYNMISSGALISSAPVQDSQVLVETRAQLQRNSRDIFTGVGSFIKSSSNEQQSTSLSDIISGFSDISYTSKSAGPVSTPANASSATQQTTTPAPHHSATKHDSSSASQSLGPYKNAEAMQHRQAATALPEHPQFHAADEPVSKAAPTHPTMTRRRSLSLTNPEYQSSPARPTSLVANLAQQSAQAQSIGADDKYSTANQTTRQMAAASVAAVVNSVTARMEQYRGSTKGSTSKDTPQYDTLRNALENAKNAIDSGSSDQGLPLMNDGNLRRHDTQPLTERERINRERERLQREREMLLHEVNRPASTHAPRNERLIKIMREMDFENGERSPTASETPPDLFNDSNPNLARDIDTANIAQNRRKSYGGSPSKGPLSQRNDSSTRMPSNRIDTRTTEKLSTPTLDSLLHKRDSDLESAVLPDPRFDSIRRRLAALAEPSSTGSMSENMLSRQHATEVLPAQRRATVSGRPVAETSKVLSSPRDLSFNKDRRGLPSTHMQTLRTAISDDSVNTPTVESITSNIRNINLNSSAAPLPTTLPGNDGIVGRIGSVATRAKTSGGSRPSIDATSVVSTIASRSRHGSITGQLPGDNVSLDSDQRTRPERTVTPDHNSDPSKINFQIYSSGINSPHPMSMSIELRDALSGHGPSDHSPIKPTNTITAGTSLRQMIRQRNKTDYFN